MCTYIAGIIGKTEKHGIVVAAGDGISHHHEALPFTVDDVGRFGIKWACEWEFYPLGSRLAWGDADGVPPLGGRQIEVEDLRPAVDEIRTRRSGG